MLCMRSRNTNNPFLLYFILLLLNLLVYNQSNAQNKKVDSLLTVLDNTVTDSARVKILNNISSEFNLSNPLKGMEYAKLALKLAQKIKYAKGESIALDNMAEGYNFTGNFNKAMEIYLDELVVDEKANNPRGMASTLMNIGILHSQQKDFQQALVYYLKTDSLIRLNHLSDIEFNIKLNLGDLYENMQQIDTALKYYFTALKLAEPIADPYFLGATYLSLGSCYDILKKDSAAFSNYKKSMQFLRKANEENLYCSALKKTAKLFLRNNQTDSALLYAYGMLEIAGKDAFQVHLLDANKLLASIYKKNNQSDSVVLYMEQANIIKDSMSSTEKIKAFQMKSINEQIRQNELAELRIKEEENRYQQLQLLLIGIFIPIFFLLTLFLSRKKIHRKAIQVLGIVSLLLLFEYLTLLLHPIVLELTHHTPILELLVFVSIAAFLIPTHHRIEHWLIEKLTIKHKEGEAGQIHIHAKKIKMKNLSNLPETDN